MMSLEWNSIIRVLSKIMVITSKCFVFSWLKYMSKKKNLPVFMSYFPHEIHGSVKCQIQSKTRTTNAYIWSLFSLSKVQTNETKRTEIAFQVINETFPFLRREPQSDLNRFLYLTQITQWLKFNDEDECKWFEWEWQNVRR